MVLEDVEYKEVTPYTDIDPKTYQVDVVLNENGQSTDFPFGTRCINLTLDLLPVGISISSSIGNISIVLNKKEYLIKMDPLSRTLEKKGY